jgi:hypothetical protein
MNLASPRLLLCSSAAALALVAATAPAAADVVSVHAEVHGGGAGGAGVSGDRKDDAFHEGATGGTYGAKLGAELVFVDAWVAHDQFIGKGGSLRTWTEFMVGLDLDMDVGAGPILDEKTQKRGRSKVYAELGMGFGFGVGTGQQVDPPLDYAQVTDKGFLFRVHAGIGRRLNRVMSIGVQLPVEAGYMFKSGPGVVANDTGTHYQSIQAALLLNLRFTFTLK